MPYMLPAAQTTSLDRDAFNTMSTSSFCFDWEPDDIPGHPWNEVVRRSWIVTRDFEHQVVLH